MSRLFLWLLCAAAVALPLSACVAKAPEPPRPPEPLIERYQKAGDLDRHPRGADLERHEAPCEAIPILPALDRYDCLIRKAIIHEGHGIPPREIKAEIMAESGGRARAVSHAGAVGVMQLKPGTFRQMLPRGDIHDREDNVRAGVRYRVWCAKFWHAGLRSEAERFGPLSLGCYNAGPGGMLNAQGGCGGYTWAEIGPCAPPRDAGLRHAHRGHGGREAMGFLGSLMAVGAVGAVAMAYFVGFNHGTAEHEAGAKGEELAALDECAGMVRAASEMLLKVASALAMHGDLAAGR